MNGRGFEKPLLRKGEVAPAGDGEGLIPYPLKPRLRKGEVAPAGDGEVSLQQGAVG